MTITKNYFIDTEFHEHKKPVKFLGITIAKVWTIDLISIGIVCEDGRTYYAMNRDLNLKYANKNKWLKENVLDKLPKKQELYPPYGSPRLWQESMRWLPMQQIREEIIDFCGGKPDSDEGGSFYRYDNGTPVFYGYYADYDWVVFCWIFGTMMQLPNGFPMFCNDLKQMLDEKLTNFKISLNDINGTKSELDREATFEEKLNWLKSQPKYPSQNNEHNALDDANWNFKLFKFIKENNWSHLNHLQRTRSDMKHKHRIIDLHRFSEWIGQNYIRLHECWVHRYADQRNKDNWKDTGELWKLWWEKQHNNGDSHTILHECPVCKQKAGKTYIAAKLPTVCQKCDHIWFIG